MRNAADFGGGIYNFGTLVMTGTSIVAANTARDGGGVHNAGMGNPYGSTWGSVTLTGSSSISGNASEYGGGISNRGDVTLDEWSSVRDNVATAIGGGIYSGHSIRVQGSSVVTGNKADVCGGVCAYEPDRVTATCGPGGNVHGNSPDDCVIL
jgi:hypothetical protein